MKLTKLNEIRLRIFYTHESALYGMGKGCGKTLCSAETADDARTSFFFSHDSKCK